MGVASYAARGKRELVLLHCSEATDLLGTVFPTGPSLWPPYVVSAQRKKYGSLARFRIRSLNSYFRTSLPIGVQLPCLGAFRRLFCVVIR